jgi:hypothetical protein
MSILPSKVRKTGKLAAQKTPFYWFADLPKITKTKWRVILMPSDSFVLTSATFMTCPHGGLIRHKPTYFDYLINGATIWLHYDQFIISCPLDELLRCSLVRWHHDNEWMINGGFILSTSASVEVFAGSLWMGVGWLRNSQTTVTVQQLVNYLKHKDK